MLKKFHKYLIVGLGTTIAMIGTAHAQQVRLMTGPQGGAWYPLGGAIANIASKISRIRKKGRGLCAPDAGCGGKAVIAAFLAPRA